MTTKFIRTAIVYQSQQFDSLESMLDDIQTRTIPTRKVTVAFDTKEEAMNPIPDEIELIGVTEEKIA